MKKLIFIYFSIIALSLAQMHNGFGHLNSDSLKTVTKTGTIIIDSSMFNKIYYLDTNNDSFADYELNFGPHWYQSPDSSVLRPLNGSIVMIKGGELNIQNNLPVIVVYEINNKLWRNPVFAMWNNFGRMNNFMKHHFGSDSLHYGFGWNHDSLKTEILSGEILIDTTFFNNVYYLDTNQDSKPNYYLNFGPYWFEPQSGATRPHNNETVSIKAGILNNGNIPMALVYELNGLVWLDSAEIGDHFGGGWMHNSSSSETFHSPFDLDDMMIVNGGWVNGGHGHMGGGSLLPDSLFCQIFEVLPQNMPNSDNENILAAYEIHIYNPDSEDMMMNSGKMGAHMQMGNNVTFNFHYNDYQLNIQNMSESDMTVKYWDDTNNAWNTINATFDPGNNKISFQNNEINSYYIVTAQSATSIFNNKEFILESFTLNQNYPNPFNPVTTIEFYLPENGTVNLIIFNVLGEKVATLLNKNLNSGLHKVTFNAENLSSGIYFYQLKFNSTIVTKKMNLLK